MMQPAGHPTIVCCRAKSLGLPTGSSSPVSRGFLIEANSRPHVRVASTPTPSNPIAAIASANKLTSFPIGVTLALCARGADTQSNNKRPDLTAQTGVVPRLYSLSLEDSMRGILFAIVIAALVSAPSLASTGQASKAGASAKVAAPAKARATAANPVNLNSASVAQLQTLPGIGASAAQRIVEYRQKNGAFKKIEELMNVKGIGEKSFLKLKPLITVGADKGEHAAGDK